MISSWVNGIVYEKLFSLMDFYVVLSSSDPYILILPDVSWEKMSKSTHHYSIFYPRGPTMVYPTPLFSLSINNNPIHTVTQPRNLDAFYFSVPHTCIPVNHQVLSGLPSKHFSHSSLLLYFWCCSLSSDGHYHFHSLSLSTFTPSSPSFPHYLEVSIAWTDFNLVSIIQRIKGKILSMTSMEEYFILTVFVFSQPIVTITKYLRRNNFKVGQAYFSYGCRGFSSCSFISVFLGLWWCRTSWKRDIVEESCSP
jgi:hypothetical protein